MKHPFFFILLLLAPFILPAQVTYDFEDGSIDGWLQVPAERWETSNVTPLSGSFSLKHSWTGTDKDRISVELPSWQGSDGTITWRFLLKHGYNPSSSNNWAVFLFCNKDANGMVSTESPDGYAVGVNLNSSDDLLKLYLVSGGTFNTLVETTINWEQEIKTGGVGAVEVKRKPDGTFSMKASTTGSFLDLNPFGSAVDNTHSFGGYFGIYYSYTSSAAGKLWVDDISIGLNPVNPNDNDSQIVEPDVQIESGFISSLACEPSNAASIFKFKVTDQGSGDGLQTKVTRMRFVKVDSSTAANWDESIAGVVIRNSSGDTIPLKASYIMGGSIEVELEPSSMVVEDGNSQTYSLSVYLKQGGTSHGETFQLKIDDEEHGWETDFSGSTFPEILPAEVVSNVFTVRVVPTHLFFLNYPEMVIINKPFNISAYAGDEAGNMSTEFSSAVTLSLFEGNGALTPSANLVSNAQGGMVTWSNISYSVHDIFKLQASASGLQSVVGNEIYVSYDTTTVVQNPTTQVEGGTISSLNTMPGMATEVLRFKILDVGSYDDEPTYVQQITIKRGEGENLASFTKNIEGVIFKVGSAIIPVGTPHILTSSITIPVPKSAITIANEGRIDLSLWVYLNEKGLEDGKQLVFMIDSVEHGFMSYAEGSSFASNFGDAVVSEVFTIEVEATRVAFSNVPEFVGLGQEFSVKVSTVDDGGNVDVDSESQITLSKNSGEGWLTIPSATTVASSGEASWSGLTYYQAEPFTILASAEGLNDAVSPLIYCADRTSTVSAPTEQVANQKISSLSVDSLAAMETIRFKIADRGETDGLSTSVSQLTFHGFGLATDMPLNKMLAGAFLVDEQDDVVTGNSTISSNQIVLNFERNILTIPDGESAELTLKVFLKKGGLSEGSTLNLYVPSSSHGWQTYTNGSGFPESFESGVVGPILQLSVEPTQLSFIEQPFSVEQSQSIALKVAATDTYSNVDVDFSANSTIDLFYGPAGFTLNSSQQQMENGIATWSDISLTEVGKYCFRVSTNQPALEALSETIWCGQSHACLYNEDFESGYPVNFPYSTAWNTSSVSPIEGEYSLKHALSGVSGESDLTLPLEVDNLGEGTFEWSFVLRNGDWDPSVDNGFWVVLASDTTNVSLGTFKGYVAGANFSGATDLLTLWRVNGNSVTSLIESEYDWNEAETVGIKVTRSPKGDWDLFYQPESSSEGFLHGGAACDRQIIKTKTLGIGFKYSASRAGEFWVDNLKACKTEFPPVISSANMLSLTSVAVNFSEIVNAEDAALASNYRIEKLNGEQIDVIGAFPDEENESKVTLRTTILPQENLMLFVSNIRDMQDNACADSVVFGLGTQGTFGNMVINEIMAKPIANAQLPNFEYIELFNRSEETILLNGWKLKANDNSFIIPDATVEANGFLILTSNSGVSELSTFGPSVGVSSFPSLVNSGMSLAITDNLSRVITWVDYSENWYGSEIKEAGGYSLEKIDPNNLVGGAENWKGSDDPSGGTPGRENSVLASNPDLISPYLTEVAVENPNSVRLLFSETMDSLSVTLPSNYSLSQIGEPLWVKTTGPKYNEVTLEFEEGMSLGEIYELCIGDGITDFSGNPFPSECLQVAVPEEPLIGDIVVNEVLFNPYSGGVDFVEIFNNSQKTFDLKNIWIANRNVETAGLNEFYAASDSAWLLFPQGYAVLCENPRLVEQFYFVENESAMVWTAKMPSYPNDEGYVLILNSLGDVIDEFHYDEGMHLPLLSSTKGVSLERIYPSLVSNDASSWQSAAQSAGFATPSAKNSQYIEPGVAEDAFDIAEQVFSPDGDGFNDVLLIDYILPEEGYIANIIVFDSMGRRVRRLASNLSLGTSGTLKWDGVTDANIKVPVGAYVIYIETFTVKENVKKNLKHYKKTCVVATKFGE
ncbi:MAG TPA: lamin tail domain-containing protein [Tenuifilaceae bacterium]|nr:lamin tail domain-containing protein [Tenuifilaceae bacterium]HPJ47047.1 lamin tail domain-containing protein [Tenuifilaceae bacterium]HPQ35562.1 lamin tail domain-containing protein [Tenuifilaceae bacterium]